LEEAGEYDITVTQRAGFMLPMRYEAPEGHPVDFTGCTAKMQARTKVGHPTVLFELSTHDDTITLGADGTIVLSEAALQTALMKFGHGVYDLFITPSAGEPYKLLKGRIYLDRAVTHP
jgi:hypothetical protein